MQIQGRSCSISIEKHYHIGGVDGNGGGRVGGREGVEVSR